MGSFTDKTSLLDFLLRRKHSRSMILQFFKSSLEKRTNPAVMAKLFDQLNVVCSSMAVEQAYDKAMSTVKGKEKKTNSFSLSEYLGLALGGSTTPQPEEASLSPSPSSVTLNNKSGTSSLNSSRPASMEISQEILSHLPVGVSMDSRFSTLISLEESAYKGGREPVHPKGLVVIDQESMYSWVFSSIWESKVCASPPSQLFLPSPPSLIC